LTRTQHASTIPRGGRRCHRDKRAITLVALALWEELTLADTSDERRLWSVVNVITNLGDICRLALLIGPPLFFGLSWSRGVWAHHPLVRYVEVSSLLPVGLIVGVTVVHPWLSQFLVRRQSSLEDVRFEVHARFRNGKRVPTEWTQVRELRVASSEGGSRRNKHLLWLWR
jgi:hypothetical protein